MSTDTSPEEQCDIDLVAKENDFVERLITPFASFIVRFPSVFIVLTLLIVIFSALLGVLSSLGAKALPDFSQPVKGFEPRGTVLSSRLKSFDNLEVALLNNELNYNITAASIKVASSNRKRREISSNQLKDKTDHRRLRRSLDGLTFYSNQLPYILNVKFVLVYKHLKSENLLQIKHMKSICEIYKSKIESQTGYFANSEPHHLPNYIGKYYGLQSCSNISKTNVDDFSNILQACAVYYINGALKTCAASSWQCSTVINETICYAHNSGVNVAAMLYNVYHFLADSSFSQNPSHLKLTLSISNTYLDSQEFFAPLYKNLLINLDDTRIDDIQVVGYDMHKLKFHLFQTEIILQSLWIIGAIVCILLFVWFYSGSLFVSLMTFLTILFALVISYFVYGRIFDMDFFPFLNMVTLIFIVGIGADDAFVYTGIWNEAKHLYVIKDKKLHHKYLTKWTAHSLRYAVLAMLVTSLTTAAAFYANMSSSITSVKCFGLYAGTSIIINYLLMITFFPAVVILHEKYFAPCMNCCCPKLCKTRPLLDITSTPTHDSEINQSVVFKVQHHFSKFSTKFFDESLPNLIFKFRYVWIVLFTCLGIGGAIVTFGKPGLNLPSTKDFQMFVSSSSLEQYELKYKKEFTFPTSAEGSREVYFIFGVKSDDNGYHFNPDSKGSLKLNPSTLRVEKEQEWLLKFCEHLRTTSFYVSSSLCSKLELFYLQLKSPCLTSSEPLCCNRTIPIPEKDFLKCIYGELIRNPQSKSTYSHPMFDKENNLQVFSIPVQTSFSYTNDNKENKVIFDSLENWFNAEKASLKETSLSNGWWFGWSFDFYDLQISLFKGTKESLGIAIAVAFVVILITSLNIFLSLYSILTIFFIISVTIGILVLRGWDLNIMESVVFSVAAGLASDFTLHYSVAYKTSSIKHDRVERTKSALRHIGGAILMGAFTTFIAGLVMLPSQVLVYFQMSQFLMLTMFVSWIYSTFFFLPLCMVIGPTGNFGQLTCSKVKRARNSIHFGPSERKKDINLNQVTQSNPEC